MTPLGELLQENFDLFGFAVREVVLLRRVLGEVVEFEAVVFEVMVKLPVPRANHGAGAGAELRVTSLSVVLLRGLKVDREVPKESAFLARSFVCWFC